MSSDDGVGRAARALSASGRLDRRRRRETALHMGAGREQRVRAKGGAPRAAGARLGRLCALASTTPAALPTFSATIEAFLEAVVSGVPAGTRAYVVRVLLMGYGLGMGCAAVLTTLAISTRIGTDLLELLTSMFNPLPAIALLPLALIWFGLGYGSIDIRLVHSVLWVVALNTHSGFLSACRRRCGWWAGTMGCGIALRRAAS